MQLLTRIFLLIVASLVTTSCAIQQRSLPQPEMVAGSQIALRDLPPPRPILARPDLSYWEMQTSYPGHDFDLYQGGFACGLVYSEPEPVALGQWNLVGISETRYTPLLDIYSDRTGQRTRNDATYYYYFQLSNPGK